MRFENNLYWHEGGVTQIAWGTQTYSGLKEWRDRTEQERLGEEPTGLFANSALSRQPPDVPPASAVDLQRGEPFVPSPVRPRSWVDWTCARSSVHPGSLCMGWGQAGLGPRTRQSDGGSPILHPDGVSTVLLRHCYGIAPMGIAMPMGAIP